MVSFLLQATELQNTPVENEKIASKVIHIFKKRIQNRHKNWWQDKLSSVENRKLDFYYQYKKNFKFEQYLDTLSRHIRKHTTKLRTSSHNFPLETLRYTKPKIEA